MKLDAQVLSDLETLIPPSDPLLRKRDGSIKGLKSDHAFKDRPWRRDKEAPAANWDELWSLAAEADSENGLGGRKRGRTGARTVALKPLYERPAPDTPADAAHVDGLRLVNLDLWMLPMSDRDERVLTSMRETYGNPESTVRDRAAALGMHKSTLADCEKRILAALKNLATRTTPALCGEVPRKKGNHR